MRYQLLGRSGLRVSELCLGTMTFGEDWGWGSSKEESRKVYDAFREAGGNFIDTANVYTNGTSETFLGDFISAERQRVVLATKYTNAMPGANDPNAAGNHRKSMFQAVEGSLKRLRTDYLDLYWLHIWDGITPIDEIMRGFDDLVRQGKILYAGISDSPAWRISEANAMAELRGWTRFVGLQIEYSLIERTVERELVPMAGALGLGITAWSPLASGLLTGKYKDSKPGDSRLSTSMMAEWAEVDDRKKRIIEAVLDVAKETGRSAAQVALNWLRSRPVPVIPIIGARKADQLRDNLTCLEWKLAPEQTAKLDEASRIELGFPHDFYTKPMVRNLIYGGMYDQIDQ